MDTLGHMLRDMFHGNMELNIARYALAPEGDCRAQGSRCKEKRCGCFLRTPVCVACGRGKRDEHASDGNLQHVVAGVGNAAGYSKGTCFACNAHYNEYFNCLACGSACRGRPHTQDDEAATG